jgi:uncharacterized protein
VPQGYRAETIRVTGADGTTQSWCVFVAETTAERERGLMDVDSLGGYDGMIFRFGRPTTAQFYMFQTVMPLSIAFYDADGAYVSSTDMAPCTAEQAGACALYQAAGPYQDSIEVAQGDLPRLGMVKGSRLEVTGQACQRP